MTDLFFLNLCVIFFVFTMFRFVIKIDRVLKLMIDVLCFCC